MQSLSRNTAELQRLVSKTLSQVETCVRFRLALEAAKASEQAPIIAAALEHGRKVRQRRYLSVVRTGKLFGLGERVSDLMSDGTIRRKLSAAKGMATRRAKRKTLSELGLNAPPMPVRLQVAASAGSGKTTAFLRGIAANEFLRQHARIHIYAPDHSLCAEHAKLIPGARVMQGRSRPDANGAPLCRRHRAADAVARAGLGVFEHLCKQQGSPECQFFDQCGWVAQWKDKGPGVRCFPHAWIPLGKPLGQPPPDLIIIDESCWKPLVSHLDMDPKELWQQGAIIGGKLVSAINRALAKPGEELAALRAAGITMADLRDAAKKLDAVSTTAQIQPNESDIAIERKVKAWASGPLRRVAKLLRALAKEIGVERDQSHGVWLNPSKRLRVGDGWEEHPRIEVAWTKRPNVPPEAGVILLDADADHAINERLFGPLAAVEFNYPRRAVVTQVDSTAMPKARLVMQGADSVRQVEALLRLLRRETEGGKRVLLVTYLAVRRLLTEEPEGERLPPAGHCEGADVAHFGAIRGLDGWKQFDTVIILGRNQPRPEAVEADARAIWADDVEPLRFIPAEGWEKTEVSLDLRGAVFPPTVEVHIHPDLRCQRLLRQIRECETLQAIDRLRLIHRETAARVIIASNLPLDGLEVDELVSWRELTKPASRFEQLYVERGILPLGARDIFRVAPDHWGSEKAAEKDLERNRPGANAPWLHPHSAMVVSYRIKGQRGPKDSTAYVDTLMHPDVPAALQEALGAEIVKCEVKRIGNGPKSAGS